MPAKTWRHVVVQAPLRRAPELMPYEVDGGRARLDVRNESSAQALWGRHSRRFRAGWEWGRASGEGYVEFRPHSNDRSEVVLHLRAPQGFWSVLWWNEQKLERIARTLALQLRHEIDAAAQRQTEIDRERAARLA
jgi:hypothetical protein